MSPANDGHWDREVSRWKQERCHDPECGHERWMHSTQHKRCVYSGDGGCSCAGWADTDQAAQANRVLGDIIFLAGGTA